ncbi:hypothetical protein DID74_00250 [Candidatus Marinamargulisbacteria bacterium SCGC AG-333-B06]|nr:hypothetical protein DID74_00250 [Candidatus Marinamargulisbacteria bacterium SCGC AG-333-B06]
MVKIYKVDDSILSLSSSLEYPIYIYLDSSKNFVLYSENINSLLNDPRIKTSLTVSDYGISFLLQSGVVPLPKTGYKELFICHYGFKFNLSTKNNKVLVNYTYKYPFSVTTRSNHSNINYNDILELIAHATIRKMHKGKDSYLFHSAGKDSNTIALALAEAGWQNKVTLISHKSRKEKDESEISKSIAKKLGFKHKKLYEADLLNNSHKNNIDNFFINSPLPCTDNVSLAYPIYLTQIPHLSHANLIDGMGNDVYMGHIPSRHEFTKQKLSFILKYFRPIADYFSSNNKLLSLTRTRSETTGLTGFSYSDSAYIMNNPLKSFSYWMTQDNFDDYISFRSSIRGCLIDNEIFTRKIRNFSDAINSNIILPFTNQAVIDYFNTLPEEFLFNRKEFRNKVVLREILMKYINLDSDNLGKMGYDFNSSLLIINNWEYFYNNIITCSYWKTNNLGLLVEKLKGNINFKGYNLNRKSRLSLSLIYRLYLISMWLNNCKYINK